MSADLLVDEYLAHLKIERGLSPATVSAYASDLARWTTFLAATNVEAPDADAGAIAGFLVSLSKSGVSPRS